MMVPNWPGSSHSQYSHFDPASSLPGSGQDYQRKYSTGQPQTARIEAISPPPPRWLFHWLFDWLQSVVFICFCSPSLYVQELIPYFVLFVPSTFSLPWLSVFSRGMSMCRDIIIVTFYCCCFLMLLWMICPLWVFSTSFLTVTATHWTLVLVFFCFLSSAIPYSGFMTLYVWFVHAGILPHCFFFLIHC